MFCSGRIIQDENRWGQKAEWKAHIATLFSPNQVGAASCLMPRAMELGGEWKCQWIQLLVEGLTWYFFLWNKESRAFQWLVWDCYQTFCFSSSSIPWERNIKVDFPPWHRTLKKTLENLVKFYSWQRWFYSPNLPDEILPAARPIIVAIT